MKIIGLTGSIAMGKSTAATMLGRMGIPVHDADATVHRLYAKGGKAVPLIRAAFPGAVSGGAVDRQKLSKQVMGHPDRLRLLEQTVHPLVEADKIRFLQNQKRVRRKFAALDNPLLLETGGQAGVDSVFVVSANKTIQRQRALARKNMRPEKLRAILKNQLSDHQKRKHADFVIPSGAGRALMYRALKKAIRRLRNRRSSR